MAGVPSPIVSPTLPEQNYPSQPNTQSPSQPSPNAQGASGVSSSSPPLTRSSTSTHTHCSLTLMGAKELAYPLVSYLPTGSTSPLSSTSTPSHPQPQPHSQPHPSGTAPLPHSHPLPHPHPHPFGSHPCPTGPTPTPLYGSAVPCTPLGHCPAASERVKLALVALGNEINNTFLFDHFH